MSSVPNYPIPQYPITEPTSALANKDLLLAVATKLRFDYYGPDGQGAPQVPVDGHDLAVCQSIVNNGIRMFLSDGPAPNGWYFTRPLAQIDLFPEVDYDPTGKTYVSLSYQPANTATLLTLYTPSNPNPGDTESAVSGNTRFTNSMELKPLWINGYPPAGFPGYFPNLTDTTASLTPVGTLFTVQNFLSSTQVTVYGDATGAGLLQTCGFSVINTGDYTMPANFSGQYVGEITFIAGTNRGVALHWVHEKTIRARRQIYSVESGTPFEAAVRLIPTPSYNLLTNAPPRRRWELMTWFASNEWLSVSFPYILSFDNLVNLTDSPPSPFSFDECIKAACMAQAEYEYEDTIQGPSWQYYKQNALKKAYEIDAREVPKTIGRFSDPGVLAGERSVRDWRDFGYVRPLADILSSAFN